MEWADRQAFFLQQNRPPRLPAPWRDTNTASQQDMRYGCPFAEAQSEVIVHADTRDIVI
jgi:hypothetical protein